MFESILHTYIYLSNDRNHALGQSACDLKVEFDAESALCSLLASIRNDRHDYSQQFRKHFALDLVFRICCNF